MERDATGYGIGREAELCVARWYTRGGSGGENIPVREHRRATLCRTANGSFRRLTQITSAEDRGEVGKVSPTSSVLSPSRK